MYRLWLAATRCESAPTPHHSEPLDADRVAPMIDLCVCATALVTTIILACMSDEIRHTQLHVPGSITMHQNTYEICKQFHMENHIITLCYYTYTPYGHRQKQNTARSSRRFKTN